MPYASLRYDVDGAVATIALDAPQTRNALSDALLTELLDAFAAARDDAAVRCVVLASTHPTVFSSGGDLARFAAADTTLFPRLFERIARLGKPVICAAGGHVLAGALGLALACDLVVASERATFGTPELQVGLFPFMVSALLVRNVGPKACAELMLLGERLDASEARRIGIVNRVVAPDELDAVVWAWAQRIAGFAPEIVRRGKDALVAARDLPLDDALELLRGELAGALRTAEAREGVAAFLERREPRWTGRS